MIYLQTHIYKRYLVVWLMLLSATLTSQNTNYNFKHFSTKDGIPDSYVSDIYEDSDGFIWLATHNDVCRFDGINFKTYNTILPNHTKIPSFSKYIFEGTDGNMWVFSPSAKPFFHNGQKFQSIPLNYEFAYPDNNGNIWFVNDSSLVKADINSLNVKTTTKDNSLTLICKERNSNIWVFDKPSLNQLNKASNNSLKSYSFSKKEIILSVLIDSKNTIWISTAQGGLIKFNPNTEHFTNYTDKQSNNKRLLSNYVISVAEIDDSTMWVATTKGINILDTKNNTLDKITRNSSKCSNELYDNNVTKIFVNSNGTKFIATRTGLDILTKKRVKLFYKTNAKNSIIDNKIDGFTEDNNQNLWIITPRGFCKFNRHDNKFTNFTNNSQSINSLKASPISIIADEKDNLWIGTWQGGISYFNTKTNIFKHYGLDIPKYNGLYISSIKVIFIDNSNNIWIGSANRGLFKYNKQNDKFDSKYYNKKLLGDGITSIIQDKKGQLWIGTSEGLLILDGTTQKLIEYISTSQSSNINISNNTITSLFIKDNVIWVGTEYGLNTINTETFKVNNFYEKDGLPSNKVLSIVDDEDDNIWITTTKGLSRITPSKNIQDGIVDLHVFTVSNSHQLESNSFIDRAMLKCKNGDIALGSINGLNIFNPKNISIDSTPIRCILTELTIDDERIVVGDSLYGKVVMHKPLTKTKLITLSYKHKTFKLNFAGLNYQNPNETRYKYMLKGFDKDWRYTDYANNTATYTNINKGEFVFIAYASNINRVWSETPLSIKIKVIPPWWRTILFYILLTLLVITALIFTYKLRVKALKNQKKQLENTVKQRTKQLNETNTELKESQEETKQQNDNLTEVNAKLEESHEEIRLQIENLAEANKQLEESEEETTQQNDELLKHRNHLEEMITERTKELNLAKLKAEESDRLKSSFLANMSHEIRTPLNAIVGFSSLFVDAGLTADEMKEYAGIITNNSASLSTIINDIIDISVIEAGQLSLLVSEFSVDNIMTELVKTYKLNNENNLIIEFVKDKAFDNLIINTDEVRFRQVITNLINNAFKFTKKGFIKFGYNVSDNTIIYFVEDSGTGIADEDKNNIFEYFRKVSPTPNKFYSGTGLGLTISQELVTKMGGKIWFESTKDVGTKFMFSLPHK